MPCPDCKEPNKSGDYDPCCNHGYGTCEASYTTGNISMCIHCGAEMHMDETDIWRHHTQMELPLKERYAVHLMEDNPDKNVSK
jgi:hypothetical protein